MNPEELKYAKTHEWVSVTDGIATVGISAFAVEALTDLVHIELPEQGAQATAGEPYCEVESVKAVSDVYAPISGEIVEVNTSLPDTLESLGDDPFGAGWIAKIKVAGEPDLSGLMDFAAYQKMCEEEG